MISLTKGNILDTNCQTITNPVNCVGVMGKGLAKQIADAYPQILPKYRVVCKSGFLRPGKLHLVKCSPHWILNFPTKIHW